MDEQYGSRLQRRVESGASLDALLKEFSSKRQPDFEALLTGLMRAHACGARELIVRALVSKTYVYQLRSGKRLPGRNVALRMALAMELTPEETQSLLCAGGRSPLGSGGRRDVVLMYALHHRLGLQETEELLGKLGESPLLSRDESD